ncbi:MAG: protein translocase subunit SecF [Cypionkella sp.]|nr:protein translocase subunit SecF [Cypionkella sp.]
MRIRLVPQKTNFNFFRWQWLTFGSSIVLMVASLLLWVVMGLNYGIDFTGGTSIRADTSQPAEIGAYRDAIQELGLGDVVISEVFDPTMETGRQAIMIRLQGTDEDTALNTNTVDAVRAALATVAPDITFSSVETIGGKVSGELVWSALLSIMAGAVGMLIYIWARFEWQFAVGAVIALVHDVLLTIGVFVLFQLRFDLTIVAGVLTILGYSINDKVVVFDRLRENLLKYKAMPLRDLMNLTCNETLSRTVMTGITVLMALVILMIFGGEVLRNFAFAIFFGTIVGTYSSIYMAKNIVLFLGLPRGEKAKKSDENDFANIDA